MLNSSGEGLASFQSSSSQKAFMKLSIFVTSLVPSEDFHLSKNTFADYPSIGRKAAPIMISGLKTKTIHPSHSTEMT